MTNTNITHIDRMRTEGILVPIWIQETFNLSGDERKEFIFNQGLIFLENRYEGDKETIQVYSCSKGYWKWWKKSFLSWELDLMRFIVDHKIEITAELYLSEMSVLAHDRTTTADWELFLKIYKR